MTISQKRMKPNVNGHKNPIFSYPEKYLKNIQALLSYSRSGGPLRAALKREMSE